MQNYDKVKNVEEFAHLGGYTTTTFRRLFKNMYNVPVYEWILDKKREGILNDLQFTKQRISVISARYGFDSLSHFCLLYTSGRFKYSALVLRAFLCQTDHYPH